MSNELDRQIGEKLNNYASDVDAEALWQAVRPPRRRWPWGLMMALLIGGVAVGATYWWSQVEHFPTEQARQTQQQPNTALAAKEAPEEVTQFLTGKKSSASANQSTTIEEELDFTPMELYGSNDENRSKELINNSLSNNKNVGIGQNPNVQEAGGAARMTEREQSYFPLSHSTEAEAAQDAAIADNTLAEASTKQMSAEAIAAEESTNARLNAVPYLPTLTFGVSAAGKLDIGAETHTEAIVDDPPSRNQQQLFVQADAAYLLPQRTLEVGGNGEAAWAADRADREKVLESISADLSVGKRWASGWQLRSGLGYTRINTQFDDSFTMETVDTMEGLQMLVFGPGNTVDSIFGPVAFYETTVREKRTYNSITQWEVPILAGYQLELGALSLLLEGGVRLQLQRNWEGETRYGMEGLQDLASQDWYRSGLAVSLQGGALLAYPLSDRLTALAGGSLRYSLQDFSTTTSPFREKYQLLGGQLGLRYGF